MVAAKLTGKKALTNQNLYILCSNIELDHVFVCKTSQAKSLFTPRFVSLFVELEYPDLIFYTKSFGLH